MADQGAPVPGLMFSDQGVPEATSAPGAPAAAELSPASPACGQGGCNPGPTRAAQPRAASAGVARNRASGSAAFAQPYSAGHVADRASPWAGDPNPISSVHLREAAAAVQTGDAMSAQPARAGAVISANPDAARTGWQQRQGPGWSVAAEERSTDVAAASAAVGPRAGAQACAGAHPAASRAPILATAPVLPSTPTPRPAPRWLQVAPEALDPDLAPASRQPPELSPPARLTAPGQAPAPDLALSAKVGAGRPGIPSGRLLVCCDVLGAAQDLAPTPGLASGPDPAPVQTAALGTLRVPRGDATWRQTLGLGSGLASPLCAPPATPRLLPAGWGRAGRTLSPSPSPSPSPGAPAAGHGSSTLSPNPGAPAAGEQNHPGNQTRTPAAGGTDTLPYSPGPGASGGEPASVPAGPGGGESAGARSGAGAAVFSGEPPSAATAPAASHAGAQGASGNSQGPVRHGRVAEAEQEGGPAGAQGGPGDGQGPAHGGSGGEAGGRAEGGARPAGRPSAPVDDSGPAVLELPDGNKVQHPSNTSGATPCQLCSAPVLRRPLCLCLALSRASTAASCRPL